MNWKRCLAMVAIGAIGASCLVPATSFADGHRVERLTTNDDATIKAGVQSLSVIREAIANGTPSAATDTARPIELSSDEKAHYSALAVRCLTRAAGGARVAGPTLPEGGGESVVMFGMSSGANGRGVWLLIENNGRFDYYFFAYDGHGQHIWGNSGNGDVYGEQNW